MAWCQPLYRPGSSTDILIFETGRVEFSQDILDNMMQSVVSSRFTQGFKKPLVETDIRVRSLLGKARISGVAGGHKCFC